MSDTPNARTALEDAGTPGDPPDTEVPALDQAVLDEFERRSQDNSGDADTPDTPDGGTEGEPGDTPPEGGPDTSVPGDAGREPVREENAPPEGSTGSTGGSDEGSEPPPPPPAPYVTVGDREFSESDIRQAVQIRDWATSLSDPQREAIDALFSGQYQLVPVGEQAPGGNPTGQGAPSPGGAPANVPPEIPAEEWEELPESFRTQFLDMQQRVNSLAQGDLEVRRQQVIENLNSGVQTFMQRHNLDEATVTPIQEQLAAMGVMPGYVQAANGDYTKAMDMALEAVYWSDPNYRKAEIDRQAAEQVEVERERAKTDATRQRKAGALSGSSGSVPREKSGPMTPADRKAAMAREIGEAMGRGAPAN